MKVEATYGTKDDPAPSHIQDVPTMNSEPRLPTKGSFKGGSPPSIPKPIFLSNLSKSRDEISFKGGSLSHPKNRNVKINKNRNHICLSGFKISQGIIFLINLKPY
jgi:hypothetical protein